MHDIVEYELAGHPQKLILKVSRAGHQSQLQHAEFWQEEHWAIRRAHCS